MTLSRDQADKKIKQDSFNQELNRHLDMLQRLAGPHWEFVLTYIQNQATLKKVDYRNNTDVQLAREYCMKSEVNRIYKRLAQIEEQGDNK